MVTTVTGTLTGTMSLTAGGHTFGVSITAPRAYTLDGETATPAGFVLAGGDALKTLSSDTDVSVHSKITDICALITLAGGDLNG